MSNEMIKAIAEHPKTSAIVVVSITSVERFWVDWGSWIFDAAGSIAGLILVCLLIIKHFLDIKAKFRKRKEIKLIKES